MAASENKLIAKQEVGRQSYPAAAVHIYEGTAVFINSSGYATNVIGTDGPNRFAGIAMLECDNSAGSAGDLHVEVLTEGVFELPLTADQASVGKDVYATDDYTFSVAQTADAVFVGRVESYVSTTKAMVQLGRLNKQDREFNVNAETLAGTKTLTVYDARIQALDPGGAGKNVDLPAVADSKGLSFFIVNTADAAEVLTVRNAAAATICTPTQNESALVFCDGATWRGIVGASN